MKNGKRCILIADDEPKMLRVLKDLLVLKQFEVICVSDGKMALQSFYTNSNVIDLILLDVMMPFVNGYDVLKEIRQSSKVPVIMLTAKSQEYDQLAGFNEGADDYISKPFSSQILLARIEAVLKRAYKSDDDKLVCGDICVLTTSKQALYKDQKLVLTRREFDLLYYLMINKNITLSREQILTNVWGYNYDGDIRTVDTHVKQLRMKFEDANYIKTVYRFGYMFEVNDEKS